MDFSVNNNQSQFNSNDQTSQSIVEISPGQDKDITVSLVKQGTQDVVSSASVSLATARDYVRSQIIASGEAKTLSDTLSVRNPQSIIDFGKPVAEKLGKCADEVLRRQDTTTLNQTSTMMVSLNKIMDKVDIGEIKDLDKNPTLFTRIFNNTQKKLDTLIGKYNNIGNEIEKVCVELRTYEQEIAASNKDLNQLYDSGIENYKELVKYIIAGELALEEVAEYKKDLQVRAQTDNQLGLDLNNLEQAEQLLAQRVQDLRLAETVALQSLPIIKALEYGNLNLARKINSSFIVTIPVFKNSITQAIMIKRQALQAQAIRALDEKTNEMIIKNAQNVANNMRMTAQMAGTSSITLETVENSWQTILDGIRDTRAINEELTHQREQDRIKIEELHNKYLSQISG